MHFAWNGIIEPELRVLARTYILVIPLHFLSVFFCLFFFALKVSEHVRVFINAHTLLVRSTLSNELSFLGSPSSPSRHFSFQIFITVQSARHGSPAALPCFIRVKNKNINKKESPVGGCNYNRETFELLRIPFLDSR